jgi:hypothetical protein
MPENPLLAPSNPIPDVSEAELRAFLRPDHEKLIDLSLSEVTESE